MSCAPGGIRCPAPSRLILCDLTARTIRLGLELLGIRVVERISSGGSHGNTKCTADATAVGYRQRRILRASVADFGLAARVIIQPQDEPVDGIIIVPAQ